MTATTEQAAMQVVAQPSCDTYGSVDTKADERKVSSVTLLGVRLPSNFFAAVRAATVSLTMSISTVYSSRFLYSSKYIGFPLFTGQFLCCLNIVVLSTILGLIASLAKKTDSSKPFWPKFTVTGRLVIRLCPAALLFFGRLFSSNGALGSTQVSTYLITRSCSIAMTCGLSMILLGYKPSGGVVGSILIIVSGLIVVVFDPASLTTAGLAFGLVAAFFTAAYSTFSKYWMPWVDNDTRVLVNYTSLLSMPIFALVAWSFGELSTAAAFFGFYGADAAPKPLTTFYGIFLLNMLASFGMSMASIYLVGVTSPVTYDVIGTTKGTFQAIGGILFLGETATIQNLVGISCSIIGSAWYGVARRDECLHKKSPVTTPLVSSKV
eukprot:Lankesteria_metandrocarpae@DN6209_c0_g1_i1.p1